MLQENIKQRPSSITFLLIICRVLKQIINIGKYLEQYNMTPKKEKKKHVSFEIEYINCSTHDKQLVDDFWAIDKSGKHTYRLEALSTKYKRSVSAIQHAGPKLSKLIYTSRCDCGKEISGTVLNRRQHKNFVRKPNEFIPKCSECENTSPQEEEPKVPAPLPPKNIMTFVFSENLSTKFSLESDITLRADKNYSIEVSKTTDGKMILNFWEY